VPPNNGTGRDVRGRFTRGDVAAIKLLFAYTIGRPADAVNPVAS
jgi:hypothetical protein